MEDKNIFIEKERQRRILLSVWAYAYEIENNPFVSDEHFDREASLSDFSIVTGHLDDWWKDNFKPYTGQWIYKHPELDKVKELYQKILIKKRGLKKED